MARLELLATQIGVRSINFVENQLKLAISWKILWTNSQCVLHWIKTKTHLTTFIENRVKEIQSCSDIDFQYVISSDKQADIASRGTTVDTLRENHVGGMAQHD